MLDVPEQPEVGAAIGFSEDDPSLSRTMVRMIGWEFAVSDAAARGELGLSRQGRVCRGHSNVLRPRSDRLSFDRPLCERTSGGFRENASDPQDGGVGSDTALRTSPFGGLSRLNRSFGVRCYRGPFTRYRYQRATGPSLGPPAAQLSCCILCASTWSPARRTCLCRGSPSSAVGLRLGSYRFRACFAGRTSPEPSVSILSENANLPLVAPWGSRSPVARPGVSRFKPVGGGRSLAESRMACQAGSEFRSWD
jgi:hypothetical protein